MLTHQLTILAFNSINLRPTQQGEGTQRQSRHFIYVKKGMIFYFLKEDLAKLNDLRVHGDGTFKSLAYIPGYYQVLTLSVKITSADKSRAMPYPIVDVLMPNRTKASYKEVFEMLKEVHMQHFGVPLQIKQFACDMVSDLPI